MPNELRTKPKKDKTRKPSREEAERYAIIIEKFRDFLRSTAIDDRIRFGRTRAQPPEDHDKLIDWCMEFDNLERCSEAIRRIMARYIPTERMFAIEGAPRGVDWRAVDSVLQSSIDDLITVMAFMDIINKDSRLSDDLATLDDCLQRMRFVRDSGWFAQIVPPYVFD